MSLLAYSMSEFKSLILPALEMAGARGVVEIGSERGGMTSTLLDYAKEHSGWMVSIDPDPHPEAAALLSRTPYGVLHRDLSLRAIHQIPPADAYLVDGDHNYFTVGGELLLIERQFALGGKPFLAFVHDVGWPCAYRDQYCNPELIPSEWRQPFTWDRGITLDDPGTVAGGFRGCGKWACALEEGGERNGVLKSIEDFLEPRNGELEFALIPAVFGLGIIYASAAPWASTLGALLAPWNRNPLLAALERNRLENYLRVIELQDDLAASESQKEPVTTDVL